MEFGTKEFIIAEAKGNPFKEWTEKYNLETVMEFIEMLMQNAEDVAEVEDDDAENIYENYVDNFKSDLSILENQLKDFLN